MPYADMNQRPQFIAGLRTLAAYLDAHPEVPAPVRVDVMVFARGDDHVMRAEIDRIAALIGSQSRTTEPSHNQYCAERNFGPVTYSAVAVLSAARAEHRALMSYEGAVTPDASEEM